MWLRIERVVVVRAAFCSSQVADELWVCNRPIVSHFDTAMSLFNRFGNVMKYTLSNREVLEFRHGAIIGSGSGSYVLLPEFVALEEQADSIVVQTEFHHHVASVRKRLEARVILAQVEGNED